MCVVRHLAAFTLQPDLDIHTTADMITSALENIFIDSRSPLTQAHTLPPAGGACVQLMH